MTKVRGGRHYKEVPPATSDCLRASPLPTLRLHDTKLCYVPFPLEESFMVDPDPELARFLSSLSLWLDGVSKFMAVTKSEWRNASTSHHLMSQKLRQHTLELKKQAAALSDRYRINEDLSAGSDE
jgi:hypothetical protein